MSLTMVGAGKLRFRAKCVGAALGLTALALMAGCGAGSSSSPGAGLVAAGPTFSVVSGTYTSVQTVTISDATPGATIYYTTSGASPTSVSTIYSGPITVSSSETVQADAIASGYSFSAVASATYVITLPTATPTFSVAPGTYTLNQTVAISDATSGATIYYTTSGTPPTTASAVYSGPITVSSSETVEAIAVAAGYTTSAVASAAYVLNLPAAAPTFSIAPGTYTSSQTVAILSTTPGATIYYTTNGTSPTTGSAVYSGPVTVSSSETVEAIAVAGGYTTSAVASAAYVILQPPVANAGGPYTGTAGTVLSFNGAASTDPQGQTLTYAWNFGDSTTGTGANPSHTYSAAGTYTVSLIVTDTSHLTGTASATATIGGVSALSPVANPGGPYTAGIGASVSFDGSGSTDPRGLALGYTWNFGDGTALAGGKFATHLYSTAGTYTVTLTVNDTANLTGSATTTATISGYPVAKAGGPYTGTVGLPVAFNGSGSTDPQGEALTYSWNFEDGSAAQAGATPMHTYSAAGTYLAELTVTDSSNLSSTVTFQVTIYAPPIVNPGGAYTGTAGTAVNFNGGGSTDPQGQTLTYAWNFGDGGTATGVTPSHTYATAGSYSVSLTVTNTAKLTATASTAAAIVNPGSNVAGFVYEGTKPILGAHVYLLAANTTGYGQPSVSLLNAGKTGYSDTVGAYVLTASDGSFAWSGDYICTPGTQVYAYVLGGTTGSGTNPASGLMAALGSCPSAGNFGSLPYVWVNEVSTIAAAYAFAGFAIDATHVSSSGTALAQVGIANAFANAANLAGLSTGAALISTPAGNGSVPQSTLNSLADILASCVNSRASCSALLSTATSDGTATGTASTDTATAAINIAHHPAANVASLYSLAQTTQVYTPALGYQPLDFTVVLEFFAGYVLQSSSSPFAGQFAAIAVDGAGTVWVNVGIQAIEFPSPVGTRAIKFVPYSQGGIIVGGHTIAIDPFGSVWAMTGNSVYEFSLSGTLESPAAGYAAAPELQNPSAYGGLAIDGMGDAWVVNSQGTNAVELSKTGTVLSPSGGYAANIGMVGYPGPSIAVDGLSNIWVSGGGVAKLSNSGAVLSPSGGYAGSGAIAIDGSGDAWLAEFNGISEVSSSGAVKTYPTGFALPTLWDIAVDGAGNVWSANTSLLDSALIELSNSGTLLSPAESAPYAGNGGFANNFQLFAPQHIAIDGSGNVWATNYSNALNEVVGIAVPVVTPISVGVKNNMLGSRP